MREINYNIIIIPLIYLTLTLRSISQLGRAGELGEFAACNVRVATCVLQRA